MAGKNIREIRKGLKKVWWFIWESNSIWSWVVNIILAFIIIKFIVYPVLGLMLGTSYPVVAVISSSMEHPGSFDEWWGLDSCCTDYTCKNRISQEELYIPYLITKTKFKDFRFKDGFNKGDIMVLTGADNVEVGDTIVFHVDFRPDPIIHRVVEITDEGYFTKGDNNCGSADFEKGVQNDKVIGEAVLRVPYLGWIKIGFMKMLMFFRGGG